MYLLVSEAMAQHILITVKHSPWRIDAISYQHQKKWHNIARLKSSNQTRF